MGAYLAAAALDQLAQAQAELERHLVTGPDGRCLGCGRFEPCAIRDRLEALFMQYGRLPKRRPGITKVGTRHVEATGRSWFDG
jgi:hypothetical protein